MLEKTETNPIQKNATVIFIAYSKFLFSYSTMVSKIFILSLGIWNSLLSIKWINYYKTL